MFLNVFTFRPALRARSRWLGCLLCLALCLGAGTPAASLPLTPVKHLFDITHDFNAPSDVSVSRDGRVYVVDGVNHQVKVFDPQGRHLLSFGGKGRTDGRFMHPLGIDVAPSGTVYVADSGNHRVQVLSPDGAFLRAIDLASTDSKPADPTDVTVDEAAGRCYVVDNDHHHIRVYNLADGRQLATYGGPGADKRGFRYPFMITQDREKYLYIVDVINTRVQVLNPEGLFVTYVGGWGVEKGQFYRPKGVASAPDGHIFVSDSYMGVIQVFSPAGDFYAVLGDPAQGAVKKFKTPAGIFIDGRNRLYVVEMLAQKVSVYQIEGPARES